ncbi:MAG: WD40 repeat domain-containing protein, partial [Gammaproteobacteria bacterium]
DNTVRLWQLATGKERRALIHTRRVTCLAYSPQGTELASGSDDKTLRLWNLEQGTCQVLVSLPFPLLTLRWFNTRLHMGMQAQDNNVFSLVYEKTANGYQCRTVCNPAQVPISWPQPVKQLNINKARGLTAFRHRFLVSQGAVGEAEVTKPASIMSAALQAEHEELKRLTHIKEMVSQAIKNTTSNKRSLTEPNKTSVFKTELSISFKQWQVYLVRSQPNSPADKYVYAILEGLSPSGQSLYIRFSLEQDSSNKNYGRVNIKNHSLRKDISSEQLKIAVLELFQPEKQITPTELLVYHAGSLALTDVGNLLTILLSEAGRQQEGKANANRIIYQTEAKQSESKSNNSSLTAYPNLTWLQLLLNKCPTLKITPQAMRTLSAPPKASLLTSISSFFKAPPKINTEEEMMTFNVQDWLRTAPSPQS